MYLCSNPPGSSRSHGPLRNCPTAWARLPQHPGHPLFCFKNRLSSVLNKTFICITQGTNKYFNVIERMQRIVKSYGSLTPDWPRLNKLRFDVLLIYGRAKPTPWHRASL